MDACQINMDVATMRAIPAATTPLLSAKIAWTGTVPKARDELNAPRSEMRSERRTKLSTPNARREVSSSLANRVPEGEADPSHQAPFQRQQTLRRHHLIHPFHKTSVFLRDPRYLNTQSKLFVPWNARPSFTSLSTTTS